MSRLPSLVRASYLAALMCPLASAPSWAKDLTQQDLAHMAQASAVRMGCGVSIGVTGDMNVMGPAYMGVFLCSGLVLGAVKLLPKEQGAACWKILRRASLIYFWTAILFICAAMAFSFNAINTLAALWLVTSLIAVPAALVAAGRLIKRTVVGTFSLAKKAIVRAKTLYVRVNGNSVTLKQGLRSQTRVISLVETVACDDTAESETCLKT